MTIKHQDFLVDGIVSREQVEAILAKIWGTEKFLDSNFSKKKHQQILSFVFKDKSNLHHIRVIRCEPILFLPTPSCLLKLCQAWELASPFPPLDTVRQSSWATRSSLQSLGLLQGAHRWASHGNSFSSEAVRRTLHMKDFKQYVFDCVSFSKFPTHITPGYSQKSDIPSGGPIKIPIVWFKG